MSDDLDALADDLADFDVKKKPVARSAVEERIIAGFEDIHRSRECPSEVEFFTVRILPVILVFRRTRIGISHREISPIASLLTDRHLVV